MYEQPDWKQLSKQEQLEYLRAFLGQDQSSGMHILPSSRNSFDLKNSNYDYNRESEFYRKAMEQKEKNENIDINDTKISESTLKESLVK